MRNRAEVLANAFNDDLRELSEEAVRMANSVVSCIGPERDEWLQVSALLNKARELVQRTRCKQDREHLPIDPPQFLGRT